MIRSNLALIVIPRPSRLRAPRRAGGLGEAGS